MSTVSTSRGYRQADAAEILRKLGVTPDHVGAYYGEWSSRTSGERLASESPATGKEIGSVILATADDYERAVQSSQQAFLKWRMMPAPARGQVVREIGELIRQRKDLLGALVTLEMGKIISEGEGEVQEMIDMAEFCVGLSRQLYGLTMHSERPRHRMYEQWHPLGAIGIITAFNFPVAVWAWNAFIAAVCGDTMIWKPSPKTPLTAIACQHLVNEVLEPRGLAGVMNLVIGSNEEVGERMIADHRLPLISATGSCRMGRHVSQVVAARFGKTLLELGGNNAIIVADDAPLDLALDAILFGVVGTAGQRCTSTRRVYVQKGIAARFTEELLDAFSQVSIGDPLDREKLMGPVMDAGSVETYRRVLAQAQAAGAKVLCGGQSVQLPGELAGGYYLQPTIIKANADLPLLKEENFVPIMYLVEVDSIAEALAYQNDVPQGLSSAIFTDSLRTAEGFLSHEGSDCGIANVNIGTSGAEIGGAFGGEKETGGGREAGSDAWKSYMRRQTCTVNWSLDLPLAQGVTFGRKRKG